MHEVPEAVLVIACGDPLHEDDGVAWQVLEGLRRLQPRRTLPLLRLRHAHGLTPELAECVSHAIGVVFVSARREGTPGDVHCEAVAPPAGESLAHALCPKALLLRAQELYGRAPCAAVVSITGERFGKGETLSPAVRRALPSAIGAVIRQAKAWSAAARPTAISISESSAN